MKTVEDIFKDPAASNWLKETLSSALRRDPVDAAADAEILCEFLGQRAACHLNTDRLGLTNHPGPLFPRCGEPATA